MKRIITFLFATVSAPPCHGCKEEHTTYSDAEYVMFSDSVSLNMVLENQNYFTVPVSSTRACDYDRTFGVEVIDKGSTAIEGLHYRLLSNSVTIPAGKRSAEVRVRTYYDEFEPSDTLQFNLQLVMPEQLDWDLYPKLSRVPHAQGLHVPHRRFHRLVRRNIDLPAKLSRGGEHKRTAADQICPGPE